MTCNFFQDGFRIDIKAPATTWTCGAGAAGDSAVASIPGVAPEEEAAPEVTGIRGTDCRDGFILDPLTNLGSDNMCKRPCQV